LVTVVEGEGGDGAVFRPIGKYLFRGQERRGWLDQEEVLFLEGIFFCFFRV
jgi:hypothetical protein